jgi:hypothetical protein
LYYYALALYANAQPADAIQLLGAAENQYPKHPVANDYRLKRMEWLLASGRIAEAWQLYDQNKVDTQQIKAYDLMMVAALADQPQDSLEARAKQGKIPAVMCLGKRLWSQGSSDSRTQAKDWYNRFSIPLPKHWQKGTKKNSNLKVALLLPFQTDQVDFNRKSISNAYLYDYYYGFKKGIDSLNKVGETIELSVVDIGKDLSSFQKLITEGSLRGLDLVVGPLLTQQSHLLAQYAEKEELMVLNPINDQASITQGKKFVFSTEPVREQIAHQVAKYAISKTLADTALIIYGDQERDSLLAAQYLNALKAFPQAHCSGMYKVTKTNYAYLYEKLAVHRLDSLKHLFVAVTDPTLEAAVMSALDQNLNMTEVYASYEWLDNNLISFDQFERKHFRFFHPGYLNYQNPLASRFSRSYTEFMGVVPSLYAYKGFEHSLLFGKLLRQYRQNLPEHLRLGSFNKGIIMSGFRNSTTGGNACVPILKFNQQEIELVNDDLLKQ